MGGPTDSGPAGGIDEVHRKSRAIGDLALASAAGPGAQAPADGEGPDPDEPADVLIELNMFYPGGLREVTRDFTDLWDRFVAQQGPPPPGMPASLHGRAPVLISRKLYQCVLTRRMLADLLALDHSGPEAPASIFRAWPDYPLYTHIDRSAATVKVDAAQKSFSATGKKVVWAILDTGIDADHPHFSGLELFREKAGDPAPRPATGDLHEDFSSLVQPSLGDPVAASSPLTDDDGHGTHVAGIVSGQCPAGLSPHVASSDEALDGGFVPRPHGELQGMAPQCELVSIKVFRRIAGVAVTSSAAVIKALEYIRTEVNVSRSTLRIHGVNLSLGCEWDPTHYAAGQSPLCHAIDELVASGVLVVISAGNNGQAQAQDAPKQSVGILASITEPGHASSCITVGSTHRDAPHVFGISYTSSKGPTLDGRAKPDVVAPGEWICSAATGPFRSHAHLDGLTPEPLLTYAEHSGTSMAAPHVSGVLAGFLSCRPEYIGRPDDVKKLMVTTATDLGRDRYAQGAGLVDAMRMLTDG